MLKNIVLFDHSNIEVKHIKTNFMFSNKQTMGSKIAQKNPLTRIQI